MGIDTVPLPGVRLAESAARYLLTLHADALPDLSGLTVLVPNRRAGLDLARELTRAAGRRALIPPHITPLKAWAENAAAGNAEPQSRRLARLHAVLRRERWLGHVDKWALAGELLDLADELSAARLGGEIAGRLRALRGELLDRETALIEAVWQSFNNDGSDAQACYGRALENLGQQLASAKPKAQASPPSPQPSPEMGEGANAKPKAIYGYALGPLTALESRFLERCAASVPLKLFELDVHSGAASAVATTLHCGWRLSDPPILARAGVLANTYPNSPLQGHVRRCPAPHLEAEACAIASWVAEQLQADRRGIALIALDRETARRARALLQRMDVLVADETGWTLSTTAAAAVIDRWLECVARDFPHVELLDLLKSPFLMGEADARQDAVLALELAMRRHGVAQGMAEIHRLARQHVPHCLPWLDMLFNASRAFPQSRASLDVWLARLADSLVRLDAVAPLGADAAGADLLATLEKLRRELADDGEKYSFGEWRRWLDLALESASFVDESVDSPIVLTSLPASRGRVFDAVAIIGGDALHLPARPTPGLFSQATRAQLGLPTAAETAAQSIEDLVQLLAQGPALLTWQAWKEDEPNPPSPLVTLLQTLHRAAWNTELELQAVGVPPAWPSTPPAPTRQPAPAVSPEQLPRRYSPSAYQTLVDCPYRFFARSVLGLQELDEADDTLDKSDYGSALHRILKRFHDAVPPAERDAALALLNELSEAEFTNFPAYTAAAWRAQWAAVQPAYVDTWLAHRAAGWCYQSGETDLAVSRSVPGLGEIVLHGRVDRIDRKGDAIRVIDYKTSRAEGLRKKLKDPGEAVQLPFYAWLAEAEAAFLPIGNDRVEALTLGGETDVEAIALRLPQLLEAIARQAALPAHGVDAVCQYCEARGLCRKGMWHA